MTRIPFLSHPGEQISAGLLFSSHKIRLLSLCLAVLLAGMLACAEYTWHQMEEGISLLLRRSRRDNEGTTKVQREFPPTRSTGRWSGVLLGLAVGILATGSYLLLHFHGWDQTERYWGVWMDQATDSLPIPGQTAKSLTLAELRYRLLTEGNERHQYDRALLAYRWYPQGVQNPTAYIREHENIRPLYRPASVELIILGSLGLGPMLAGFLLGQWKDSSYERKMREGVHVSGAREIDMTEYRKHNQGTGLLFILKPREGNRRTHLV